jgi:hypothetical protein
MSDAGGGYELADDEPLTLRGEIRSSSVPALLRSLLGSGETGILTFRSADVTKSIYMKDGRIVYAASTDPDERLGELLLLKGRITARQYLEASKMIRPGRRLGAILVEMGAIDPDELIPTVEEQIREVLLDLLTWTHGHYEVVMKEVGDDSVVSLNINADNLILEGIRRTRSWTQVMRGIGNIESVPALTGQRDVLMKIELAPDEQEVLSHVNGRSTIEQVCNVSFLTHFETCRILWALQILGVVRWSLPAEAQHAGEAAKAAQGDLDLGDVVERFNQMFHRIYETLHERQGAAVDVVMDDVMREVSVSYASLFDGVDLRHYGRVDFEQMLANVADLPSDRRRALMVAALNELVFAIQLSVRQRHGAAEEAAVSGIIKEGLQRIGAIGA